MNRSRLISSTCVLALFSLTNCASFSESEQYKESSIRFTREENGGVLNIVPTIIVIDGKKNDLIGGGEEIQMKASPGLHTVVVESPNPYSPKGPMWRSNAVQLTVNPNQTMNLFIEPASEGSTYTGWSLLEKLIQYEPNTVVLVGAIERKHGFGPPNFGENPESDKKESWYVLKLENPLDVAGTKGDELNSESESNVRELQIVGKTKELRSLIGLRVEITGKLFHAHTGHHHTNVLITPSDIKQVK